jgi:DNA-binding MarR family transcriptional regulator
MKMNEFEQLKENSLGHSLIKAGRLYKSYSFNKLKETLNIESFKPSHLDLFAYIDFEGQTVVQISKRMEISKQAVSVLVNDMIEFGVLEKRDNPRDKRSFLVFFKEKSEFNVFSGMKFLANLDEELKKVIGKKEAALIQKSLIKIIKEFEQN